MTSSRRYGVALTCAASLLAAAFPTYAQTAGEVGRALLFQFYVTMVASSACGIEVTDEQQTRFYRAAADLQRRLDASQDEMDNTMRQIQAGARDNPTFCSSYRSVAQNTLRSFQ